MPAMESDINVALLRTFLENGGMIDCGTDDQQKFAFLHLVHDLGFRMGTWYEIRLGEGGSGRVPWRYLYMSTFEHELHLCNIPHDNTPEVVRLEDVVSEFGNMPVEPAMDLHILYDWI